MPSFPMLPTSPVSPLASQHSLHPHWSPAAPSHSAAALCIGWVQTSVSEHVNRIRLEPGYMKNTSQPSTEMPGFKPRGCSVCEHSLQYFKAEMPSHAIQLQGLWHLYLLRLITCSGEQSHNIPQSIMRLKQMACHIELLYQRDKEKVFNLLQPHRASIYSLATESLKIKAR